MCIPMTPHFYKFLFALPKFGAFVYFVYFNTSKLNNYMKSDVFVFG